MTTLTDIAAALKEKDNFLILTHAHPDGDTLGSAFGLCRAMQKIGKMARVVCSDPIPDSFDFLLTDIDDCIFEPDCIISVDIADAKLIGAKFAHLASKIDICIDHHASNRVDAPLRYVDAASAANCEIIYDLLKELGIEMDLQLAACLYTGISTDTGCFKFSNTTPRTHRIAAELMEYRFDIEKINYRLFEEKTRSRLEIEAIIMNTMEFFFDGRCAVARILVDDLKKTGAKEDELDGVTGLPRQIKGVDAGVLIREQPSGGCRISVRTKAPYNASEICSVFGGGGHARAAGCTIPDTVDNARDMMLDAVGRVIGEVE
ncbi:MAG: bifunctional oligoribonuclease/PAP phosphatase NrnA [Acutalibacteraceae bacterium]